MGGYLTSYYIDFVIVFCNLLGIIFEIRGIALNFLILLTDQAYAKKSP